MARKITTSTDKFGRTVYKITGTKKYAFSLVKAKKIAASLDGTSVRKPAKKTAAKKTARKTTRRPAKKTTAVTRYRGRGGKADSRFKGYDGLEMDEPMTAAERRAVLAAAKAGNRKRKPAKRTAAKRNAAGQFVKRTAAKKTTRRNAGRRMTQARMDAIMAKVRAKRSAAKKGLTLAQTKAIARTAYSLANGSMNGATAEVNASVKKAGRIGGDLYGYLAQHPDTIVEATDEHPALAAKGYFDDSGYAYEWETH